MKEFPCNVPGCIATFNTLFDFEMHYNGSHRYICLECKKSRPSARLLDIHIQETHDSFFKVLAERQAMVSSFIVEIGNLLLILSLIFQYQCYVAECDTKFKTPDDRREHCVTVHKYPKNFRFDEVPRRKDRKDRGNEMEVDKDSGPQKIRKQCGPRLNKNQKTRTFHPVGKMSVTSSEVTSSLESPDPQRRVSSLSFVPRQVTSYSKVLTKNKNLEKDVLNDGSLMELAESLPP